jgi:glycosyltransferase involved in cell wall biosynthesis
MRLLIATDAWVPQINGVVRTYQRLAVELECRGIETQFLSPADFHSVACPIYPEIRLAVPALEWVRKMVRDGHFDYIHIATEGPVGLMTRRACRRLGRPFTTSYHTRFPEYVSQLAGVPEWLGYRAVRRFHNSGAGTMVATPSLRRELRGRGFKHLMSWTRGVDTEMFRPRNIRRFGSDAPVFLYVGRVSREKNIEAFLSADLPGKKVVVGDGPHLEALRSAFPDATFTGALTGEALAEAYASSDVFVFPSLTDTFGLVLLEALASGVPVAAYPVTGPLDILIPGVSGEMDLNLAAAAKKALTLSGGDARASSLRYNWSNAAAMFLNNIETAHRRHQRRNKAGASLFGRRPAFWFRGFTARG